MALEAVTEKLGIYEAAEDLSSSRYKAVTINNLNASPMWQLPYSQKATGIIVNNPKAGEACAVVLSGICPAVFSNENGSVVLGDKLTYKADGTLIKADPGDVVLAIAYEASSVSCTLSVYCIGIAGNTVQVTIPANTVEVNSLADLPPAIGGEHILPLAIYRINNTITLEGTNKVTLQNGAALVSDSAQIGKIIGSGPITVDTTAGAFNTFLLKGALRIQNNSVGGVCVNLKSGGFLISQGVLHAGTTGGGSIALNSESGAVAISVENMTALASDIGIKCNQSLSFGATLKSFNSSNLPGKGIVFDGDLNTSNFGVISVIDGIIGSAEESFVLNGKASSLLFSGSRFNSTNRSAALITSSNTNRINNFSLANTNLTGGGTDKHGLDISSAYFETVSCSASLISTTGTGLSRAIKGQVEANTPFSGSANFVATTLLTSNATPGTNVLEGMSKKDLRVTFRACTGVVDSVTTGAYRLKAGETGTFTTSATPNTYTKIAGTNVESASNADILERVSHTTSTSDNALVHTGLATRPAKLSYTISCKKTSGASVDLVFGIGRNGTVIPDTEVTQTMLTGEYNTVSLDLPYTIDPTDSFSLYVKSAEASSALTFATTNLNLSTG